MTQQPTTHRVALYVCSATRNRLPALRKYARERGWTVAGEYVDHRMGGEALDRMIAADHACEHDGVLLRSLRGNEVHSYSNQQLPAAFRKPGHSPEPQPKPQPGSDTTPVPADPEEDAPTFRHGRCE